MKLRYCVITVHTTEEWLTSLKKKIAHWPKIYL